MRIFNQGQRTIQFEGGTITKNGNATVSTEIGNKLMSMYPTEIIDMNATHAETHGITDPATTREGPQPFIGTTTGAGEPLTAEQEAAMAKDSEAAEKLRQDGIKKPGSKDGDENTSTVKISPAAQEFADANGIDVSTLKGSGLNGLITKPDVQSAIDAKDKK